MPIFVQNRLDTLIAGLGTELYELAVTAPAMTPETAAPSVNFSIPYYTTFGQIVIRRGDPVIRGTEGAQGQDGRNPEGEPDHRDPVPQPRHRAEDL